MAYATPADFAELIEAFEPVTPLHAEQLERLLRRAERDIDHHIGGPLTATGALKLNPLLLTVGQAAALRRATIWQAYYRHLQRGEADNEQFFIEGQREFVSTPDLTVRGALPTISPAAETELAGSGLVQQWRTVTPPAVVPPII